MIRKANKDDIPAVAELYNIMIDYEDTHVKYTSWQKDIYPTAATARLGVKANTLYVIEEDGSIVGSVILDTKQPPEYRKVSWSVDAKRGQALVIHTLCVMPEHSGGGLGTALVDLAKDVARESGCLCVRLNTSSRNLPAKHLYEKNGFYIAATEPMLLNGQIACGEHLFMECKI